MSLRYAAAASTARANAKCETKGVSYAGALIARLSLRVWPHLTANLIVFGLARRVAKAKFAQVTAIIYFPGSVLTLTVTSFWP